MASWRRSAQRSTSWRRCGGNCTSTVQRKQSLGGTSLTDCLCVQVSDCGGGWACRSGGRQVGGPDLPGAAAAAEELI